MSANHSGDANAPERDANGSPPPTRPVRPSWEVAAEIAQPARPVPAPRPVPPSFAPPPAYVPPPTAAPPTAGYAPPMESSVQYDLAGNPIPQMAAAPSPYASPGAPGVWPPPPSVPAGQSSGWQSFGDATDRVARLKWNWGAFFIPFWWCIFNGQRQIAWGVFGLNMASRFIPAPFGYAINLAQIGISIYLGLMGHRLAWASGRFAGDYDQYIRVQRSWMVAGFILAGVIFLGLVAIFALAPGIFSSAFGSSPQYGNPHGGSFGRSGSGLPASP